MSKIKTIVFTFLVFCSTLVAQNSGFYLTNDLNKVKIPFKSYGNQMVLPVMINGVKFNFALDTGSTKTILFDFEGIDSLNIKKDRLIKYTGYGEKDYFEAYSSLGNKLVIDDQVFNDQMDLLIMKDEYFNLTERLGFKINGVIGKSFFDAFVVHINNEKQYLQIFKNDQKLPRKIRRAQQYPLEFIDGKPHTNGLLKNQKTNLGVACVIDTGNSDALLTFNLDTLNFKNTRKGFEDYLGYGLNGKVYGKRTKIDEFELWGHNLNEVTISVPYMDFISDEKKTRVNYTSIGSEILRRFNLTFDYANKVIYVEPLSRISEGFFYNMTGMNVVQDGFYVEASLNNITFGNSKGLYKEHEGQVTLSRAQRVSYNLMPKLVVESVVEGSLADEAGLQVGDQILKANGVSEKKLTLQRLSDMFHSKPYTTLKIDLLRDGVEIKKELYLVPLIE